jgi:hypothetical protein
MKAIMLKPKWANLIADGVKTLETRSWTTRYRGPIIIAASQPQGETVCTAEIVNCRKMIKEDEKASCVDFSPLLFVFELQNIQLVKPEKIKGKLGIFEFEGNHDQ